jgi:predicted ATPase/DNA-binding CsgD family transcriptional regulator
MMHMAWNEQSSDSSADVAHDESSDRADDVREPDEQLPDHRAIRLQIPAQTPRLVLLPHQPTPIIGREDEIALLVNMVMRAEARLITITGAGGIGKTRLACEVAERSASAFQVVTFLDLAQAHDAEDAAARITRHLSEVVPPSRSARKQAAATSTRILIVLDNAEGVLGVAGTIADLLAERPGLQFIVTSRLALHIRWEQLFPVSVLPVPDPRALPSRDDLMRIPSIALFISVVKRIQPQFELTEHNAATIASICARMDGLPLALELAATQTLKLPLSGILQRLDKRLDVLTDGAIDLPLRQRSLRATLDSSYVLLNPAEQALARRIAIFEQDTRAEVIAAVVHLPSDDPAIVVEDLLPSLATHHLLQLRIDDDDTLRITMLETIRDYLREQLRLAGEYDVVHQHYVSHFLSRLPQHLALTFLQTTIDPDAINQDIADLRGILRWSVEQRQPDTGLAVATGLWQFWLIRGQASEGLQWFNTLFAAWRDHRQGPIPVPAMAIAGMLAIRRGDLRTAETWLAEAHERSVTESAESSPEWLTIEMANVLLMRGEIDQAERLVTSVFNGSATVIDSASRTLGQYVVARIAAERHDLAGARGQLRQCRAEHEPGKETAIAGTIATRLGVIALALDDPSEAYDEFQRALRLSQQPQHVFLQTRATIGLGDVALFSRDLRTAREYYLLALTLLRQHSNWHGLLRLSESVVCYAALTGASPEAIAQLHQQVTTLRDAMGVAPEWAREVWLRRFVTTLASNEPTTAPREASSGINDAHIANVIEQALATTDSPVMTTLEHRPEQQSGDAYQSLSNREREVVLFIARGLTNRQIAVALGIAERTIDSHVGNILRKLGLHSRAQVAAWVARLGLLADDAMS